MSENIEQPARPLIYKRQDQAKFKKSVAAPLVCKIKEDCGTCKFINDPYHDSLKEKWDQGIKLLKEHGLMNGVHAEAPEPALRPLGYRNHAKLSVRSHEAAVKAASNSRFAIGIYRKGTHDLVDISDCPLHRETITVLLADLKAELEPSSIKPFDEQTHSGDLRYVTIRSSHVTNEVMITYVITNELVKHELKAITLKLRERGHQIQSAHINLNNQVGNVIFGDSTSRLLGSDRLRESLADLSFEIGPTSFFQVNPWEADRIYRRVAQLSGMKGRAQVAWDLYCGIGQIAMTLSRAGYRVLGMEVNPQAIRDAQKNAQRNLDANHPTFICGRVEDEINLIPQWAKTPKLIVTNPSRKGLAPEVREFLRKLLEENRQTQLIYVSCEIETLVRDLGDLTGTSAKLRQLEGFDMFPFTDKMEWLAVVR